MVELFSRLSRGADWPPELHRATDRYEAASSAVSRARYQGEFNAAMTEMEAADRQRKALMLALDKRRRPEAYKPPVRLCMQCKHHGGGAGKTAFCRALRDYLVKARKVCLGEKWEAGR